MTLDFRGLNNIANKEERKDDPEESPKESIEKIAVIKLNREKEDNERLREAYSEYQKNIRLSESIRAEILKGVNAGESIETLFLKAIECIGYMTGEKLFYEQIRKKIKRNE